MGRSLSRPARHHRETLVANPFDQFDSTPAEQQRITVAGPKPVDPYKARDQAIQEQANARGESSEARASRAEQRAIEAANKPSAAQAKVASADRSQRADIGIVAQQVNRVQQLYRNDLKGVGLGSVGEYLPTPKMQRFEAQSRALAVLLKPLIRGPGEGPFTDKDQAILDRLVPTRFTSDIDNEQRIESLKQFITSKMKKHGGNARRVPIQEGKKQGGGWKPPAGVTIEPME